MLSTALAVFFVFSGLGACNSTPSRPARHTETGVAAWYGSQFQGRPTASGERFDQNAMTAAHKRLPFGTVVQVTHLENQKTVRVRINDRGPFTEGRIIDLSHGAAEKLDMISTGLAKVRIEVVSWGGR